MEEMIPKLHEVLNIGYRILEELEKEEPDVEDLKNLYQKRSAVLEQVRTECRKNAAECMEHAPGSEALEPVRQIFSHLDLLEKELNSKIRQLKSQKAGYLWQIDQVKRSKTGYGAHEGQQPSSLFVDIKPGLN